MVASYSASFMPDRYGNSRKVLTNLPKCPLQSLSPAAGSR